MCVEGLGGGPPIDAVVPLPRLRCRTQHTLVSRLFLLRSYEQNRHGCIDLPPVMEVLLQNGAASGHAWRKRQFVWWGTGPEARAFSEACEEERRFSVTARIC